MRNSLLQQCSVECIVVKQILHTCSQKLALPDMQDDSKSLEMKKTHPSQLLMDYFYFNQYVSKSIYSCVPNDSKFKGQVCPTAPIRHAEKMAKSLFFRKSVFEFYTVLNTNSSYLRKTVSLVIFHKK